MNETPDVCVVYVTAPDETTALRLGRELVEAGHAACANLWTGMRSVYRWKGETCVDDEVVLLLKTRRSQAEALVAAIEAAHPYETPCALVLDVAAGADEYVRWLHACVDG